MASLLQSSVSRGPVLGARSGRGALRALPRKSRRGGFKGPVAEQKTPQEIGEQFVQTVRTECTNFFQRYDVVSTSVGALSVTSYCVWRGQDPWLALSITAASVVTALVVNEVFYGDEQAPR